MGLLDRLRGANQVSRYADIQPSRALATPFAGENHLSPAVVLDDIFNARVKPVTRAEAMSVPAWKRARDLVCVTLARQPLRVYRKGEDGTPVALDDQPTWLTRSAYYPPQLRMTLTIDDVAHNGMALWVLDRGEPDSSGRRQVLDACRVAPQHWKIERGQVVVTVDGKSKVIPDGEYLLIPGHSEGLLTVAADTIRGAKNLERQWQARVNNPVPVTEIRYTGVEELEVDEMRDIRTKFIEARADDDGTVMVTPSGFEVHPHGDNAPDLFVQGRNAGGLDIARFWGIRASMLDVSQVNGSSIDYENNAIGRSEFYDLALRNWAMPIEVALSQDDVLPRGQYVVFDLSDITTPDTGIGPVLED